MWHMNIIEVCSEPYIFCIVLCIIIIILPHIIIEALYDNNNIRQKKYTYFAKLNNYKLTIHKADS